MEGMDHLPALPIPATEIWRYRSAGDKEKCESSKSAVSLARLTSAASHPANVRFAIFINGTSTDVQTLWLDYQGNEVTYTEMSPHTSYRQHTFNGHPWIARDILTKRRLCFSRVVRTFLHKPAPWCVSVPQDSRNQQVAFAQHTELVTYLKIHEPPSVRWSPASHRLFPGAHKDAVRTLLLCHSCDGQRAATATAARRLGMLPKHIIVDSVLPKAAPLLWQSADYEEPEGKRDIGPIFIPDSIKDEVMLSEVPEVAI